MRFRISILFAVFIPAALLAIWIRPLVVGCPLWTPFSIEALAEHREKNRMVLVYFRDDWWQGFEKIELEELQTERIEQELRYSSAVSLIANETLLHTETRDELFRISGSVNLPVVAVYPRNSSSPPIVVKGAIDEKAILDAISRARKIQ